MKPRAEFLVEKRDGSVERVRASKIARSILLAMVEAGVPEPDRALDVTAAVLAGLRSVRRRGLPLPTHRIAVAVSRALAATGYAGVAGRFEAVGRERRRRSALWHDLASGRRQAGALSGGADGDGGCSRSRWAEV